MPKFKASFNFKKSVDKTVSIVTAVVDKAYQVFDPKGAVERKKAQYHLQMVNRAFDKGKDRLQTNLHSGSADYDAQWDIVEIRRLSRIHGQNNAIAAGALKLKTTMVVGSGLIPNPQIDGSVLGLDQAQVKALEKEFLSRFNLWENSPYCDHESTLSFREMQGVAYRQIKENGDVLRLFNQTENGLSVHLVEADLVSNPNLKSDMLIEENDRFFGIVQGVAKENGKPIGYYVCNTHPQGDIQTGSQKWVAIARFNQVTGREQALLLANRHRPGMTRGLPDLTPTLTSLIALGSYTKSELDAANIAALFGLFIKSPRPDTVMSGISDGINTNGSNSAGRATSDEVTLGTNAITVLGDGESIEAVNSNRPNQNFGGFVEAIVQQIAMAIEIPCEVLLKSFSSSYSASRASLLEAWRVFYQERQWFVSKFCQPVWEEFLHIEIMSGRINLPAYVLGDELTRKAFLRCEWVGTAQGQIDEVKEIVAAKMRVQAGFSTMEQETAKLSGSDWEVITQQRAKEKAYLEENGLAEMTESFQVYIQGNSS
jgi:lambda family phage portal protein